MENPVKTLCFDAGLLVVALGGVSSRLQACMDGETAPAVANAAIGLATATEDVQKRYRQLCRAVKDEQAYRAKKEGC
jgi:hypothetical protein